MANPQWDGPSAQEDFLEQVAGYFRLAFPPGVAKAPHLLGPPKPKVSVELGGVQGHLWAYIGPLKGDNECLCIEYNIWPWAPKGSPKGRAIFLSQSFSLDILADHRSHDLVGWLSIVRGDLDRRVFRDLAPGEQLIIGNLLFVKVSEPFEPQVRLAPAPSLRRQLPDKGPIRLILETTPQDDQPRWTWRTLTKKFCGFNTLEEIIQTVPGLP